MQVKLISLTSSKVFLNPGVVGESEKPLSAEQLIIYTARVSNPGNQMNHATAPELIAYLVKNKHWSPFEMASMCVEIVTSRAIAQQILRHRSFSFQEFSQRYAEVTEFEPVQIRRQAAKNRQSSTESFDPVLFNGEGEKASDMIAEHVAISQHLYKGLLDAGVAKECARMVLPLTTQSTLYMNGTVRSWIHYLAERTKPGVQKEHRDIALEVLGIFGAEFPDITHATGIGYAD